MASEDLSSKINRLKAGLQKESKRALLNSLVSGADLLKKEPVERLLPEMERFVPGQVRETEQGSCFVTDEFFSFDQHFGSYPLESLANLNASELIETFGLEPGEGGSERILFIDTETTGLAGGTGTYAFQIGIGFLDEGGFRVQQFFMRDYDEEPGQMALLAEAIRDCGLIVTYNGASFDLPLIRTRFVFNRIRLALEDYPHLDLLPVARRLWKPAYGAANLSFLEEKILGNVREGDVPGALIPTLYFQFLRGASPSTLAPVFYHNRMDIVGLAALAERAFSCHRFPDRIKDDWERYGVCRFFEKRNLLEEGLKVLSPLLEKKREDCPAWHPGCRLGGLLWKRLGDPRKAAEIWWKVYHEAPFDPFVRVELAKILEHRERDLEQAHRLVEEVFEGYGITPEAIEEGGLDLFDSEEVEVEYDYAEGVRGWQDDVPSSEIGGFDPSAFIRMAQVPVPKLTDRLRQDLNRRLHRLKKKLARN